jgi:uncharacterized membrane protein
MVEGPVLGPVSLPPVAAPFFRLSYLYVLAGLETVYLFVAALAPRPWVELPLGLLTLLLAPGYAIGALALGPRNRLPRSLTFALVVGWSVAVNVGVGILLLALHEGLPPLVLAGVAFFLVGTAAAYWSYQALQARGARAVSEATQRLQLKGYRPAQRLVAYVLLLLIAVVFVVILYLASVFPNPAPGLIFSITGYGGTSANLPPRGAVNATLTIWVIIQNGPSAQNYTLVLLSLAQGTAPTSYRSISWAIPLTLGNATSASDPVPLRASQSATVYVEFEFPTPGSYLLQFLLEAPGGTVVRSASWPILIT